MIKIDKIIHIEPYIITCAFNNGMVKKLDVKPLLEQHLHLDGVSKLLQQKNFEKARVGAMGEILWDDIVNIHYKEEEQLWAYDISPEFAFQHST